MSRDLRSALDDVDQALARLRSMIAIGSTAVSPHVTQMAWTLVSELLHKRAPAWRAVQLYKAAAGVIGVTASAAFMEDLRASLRSHGKIEYEVEAIEDVLIKHYRARTCS